MTLWMRHRSGMREGKRGRQWRILDADGALRYGAFARRVPGPIDVWERDDESRLVVLGRPRKSFPVTGRYDVRLPGGENIGVAGRGGHVRDADGQKLGRFHDARSLKQLMGEGLAEAAFNTLLGLADAASDAGTGARAFLLRLEGLPDGKLLRQRMPFVPEGEPERKPNRATNVLRKVLPRRTGDALLERKPPHGWLLEVPDTGTVPEPLLLVAALLAIEVALW